MQPDLIHHLAVASIEEIAMTEAEQANKAGQRWGAHRYRLKPACPPYSLPGTSG
jgi:hypothetical protein